MRMSCNGCRVLRQACGHNCSIRPCLQWIKSPQSQANATVFLAKFYGRTGLVNLLNSGPAHLRPANFRSLLYEACGRIVNPVYGSVGLLWNNNWGLCQAAVEAVLRGEPIAPMSAESAAAAPPVKGYGIRQLLASGSRVSSGLHRVEKARSAFKRRAEGGRMAALAGAVVAECSHGEMTAESFVSGETAPVNAEGNEEAELDLRLRL